MRLKVRGRVNLIGAVAALGMLVLLGISLLRLSAAMHDDTERGTQHVVEAARSIVARYHAEELAGRMSRADAQKAALTTLSVLRYGEQDYFWVNDLHPRMLMHPIKPELDGTDLTNNRDADGKAMFVAMADIVRRQGSGFLEYNWNKPGEVEAVPKLSYVTGFQPWGWVIGSGVYIDRIDTAVFDAARTMSLLALAVLALVWLCSRWIGRSISQPVEALSARMRTLAEGDTDTDIPGGGFVFGGTAPLVRTWRGVSRLRSTRTGGGVWLKAEPVPPYRDFSASVPCRTPAQAGVQSQAELRFAPPTPGPLPTRGYARVDHIVILTLGLPPACAGMRQRDGLTFDLSQRNLAGQDWTWVAPCGNVVPAPSLPGSGNATRPRRIDPRRATPRAALRRWRVPCPATRPVRAGGRSRYSPG